MPDSKPKNLWRFLRFSIGELFHGSPAYWLWVGFLVLCVAAGGVGYFFQLRDGLLVTNMTNQVSWGFYISNFVFFVATSFVAAIVVAALRLTNNEWRRPFVRLAEIVAAGRQIATAVPDVFIAALGAEARARAGPGRVPSARPGLQVSPRL